MIGLMKLLSGFKNLIHTKTFLVSFGISLVWILGSDFVVHNLIPAKYNTEYLQNLKGIAYIFVLSVILSWLHKKELKTNHLLLAQRKQSLLGDFSGMIVHEVKNPLHSIQLCMQRIEETNEGNVKSEKYIHLAQDSLSRLDETINFLQNLSRGGRIDHFDKSQVIDLKDRLSKIFSFISKSYYSIQLKIEFVDMDDLKIRGNDSLLSHVFLNLFKNAMDYMNELDREEGVITITNLSNDEFVILGFANSGPAISKEVQRELFNHFTTKNGREGTGLGLIFCRQILTAHGGTIEYSSRADHPQFNLYFPKESKSA